MTPACDEMPATRRLAFALAWAGLALLVPTGARLEADAVTPPPEPRARGHCEIRFFGTSTLHDFSGEVRSQPFALELGTASESGARAWSGSVRVAVSEMSTGIGRRDASMRSMFEAERFPHIVASFEGVTAESLAASAAGGAPTLGFDLTIREVTRSVSARISGWEPRTDAASFDAEFELSLADFGLEVPPVLGLLRVGDAVRVEARVHVVLPAPAPDPAGGPS